MKRLFVFAVCFIICSSCSSPASPFSGVFADTQTYESWLSDPNDELLVARDVVVDSISYKVLPNSVFISNSEKVFAAPGGKWEILENKFTNRSTVQLKIASLVNSNITATINITILGTNEVYFSIINATKEMMDELDASFLGIGRDQKYHLCAKN